MRMWPKEFRKSTEDMILCMADIIKENRLLRDEVARLDAQVRELRGRKTPKIEATVNIALQGLLSGEPASETVRKMKLEELR